MEEDIFIKIGANELKWQLYKYQKTSRSFLKIDIIISIEFMITCFFFWSSTNQSFPLLIPEVIFSLIIIANNIHGHKILDKQLYNHYIYYVFLRVVIEVYRLMKCILQAYGASFDFKDHHPGPDQDIYRYMGVAIEIAGIIVMCILFVIMRRSLKL